MVSEEEKWCRSLTDKRLRTMDSVMGGAASFPMSCEL